MTALDTIIAAAFEAKRAIEQRHQTQANNLKDWAEGIKSSDKKCVVCRFREWLKSRRKNVLPVKVIIDEIKSSAQPHEENESHIVAQSPKEWAMQFYKQNEKLPSIRRLAEIAGVSEWKARKALAELKTQIS